MRRLVIASLASLITLSAVPEGRAAETYQFYRGVRSLGMGGAYTGIVNDETAVLTNPAGLGKLREFTYTLADPEIHYGFRNTEAVKSGDIINSFSIQELYHILDRSRGIHYHFRTQAFPSIVGPNFGIGLHAKYSYDAEVSADGTVYKLDYTNDYAAAMGFTFRFLDGILKIGIAGRLVDRTEIRKELLPANAPFEIHSLASEGIGFGADVGMIVTAPIAMLPSLSAVLRDAGGTSYTLGNGTQRPTSSRPQDTPQTLDAGITLSPILSNRARMAITAEYHDVLTASQETDQMRRVHAGVEFNFADFAFIRGGMNQRYWTAGVEIATERFQLQAATYGEEIGTLESNKEDRRFVGKFSLRY